MVAKFYYFDRKLHFLPCVLPNCMQLFAGFGKTMIGIDPNFIQETHMRSASNFRCVSWQLPNGAVGLSCIIHPLRVGNELLGLSACHGNLCVVNVKIDILVASSCRRYPIEPWSKTKNQFIVVALLHCDPCCCFVAL